MTRRAQMTRRAKTAETIRSIQLGGREVVYTLRRSNQRRTIGLIVNHEGLKVASPWYVPLAEIYALIERSEEWVVEKLRDWQAHRPHTRRWVGGETLHFLGREIRLHVDIALLGHGAFLSRDVLRVYAADRASVGQTAIAWYRDEALRHFEARIAAIAPSLGVEPRRLVISNAKQQWGSCNTKGEVRLNWRLMQAAPVVIDYVVAHELAHLRHMDHGPRFWATVESVCPDYLRLREELKQKDVAYRSL